MKPLAPEIIAPPYSSLGRTIAIAIGCGFGGAVLGLVSVMPPPDAPVALALRAPVSIAQPVQIVANEAAAPAVDPRAGEVALAFPAGGKTYVKLADIAIETEDRKLAGIALPPHGALRLHDGSEADWRTTAVAPVKLADVPEAYRAWSGRKVTVDGTCQATVTGFAVASRLVGDPAYAGIEDDRDRWTAKTAFANGHQMLVAQLDRCKGRVVRDAALAPVVELEPQTDATAIASAKRALIASSAGNAAAEDWKASEAKGEWHSDEATTFDAQVVRHPVTGERFVAMHAMTPFACGGPSFSILGLYRIGADGALAPVVERSLSDVGKLVRLFDVDGDGALELIGEPLFEELTLEHVDGRVIDGLSVPFYGCPC